MNSEKELFHKIALVVKEKSELSKLYNDLNKAITANNIQSIWSLSKIITRYHFKTPTD